MSEVQHGADWWLASDGKWYPPQSRPNALPPPPPSPFDTPPSLPSRSYGPAWLLPDHVSGWAVASGYLGLITFILFGIPGPFAVWTGVRGLRAITRDPSLNGKVRAWVGITLGVPGTIVLILVALVVLL